MVFQAASNFWDSSAVRAFWHGDVSQHLCGLLLPAELAAVESAGLRRGTVTACWRVLAEAEAKDVVPWGPAAAAELASMAGHGPKALFLWLVCRRRSFAAVPTRWVPLVRALSSCRLEALPWPGSGRPSGTEARSGTWEVGEPRGEASGDAGGADAATSVSVALSMGSSWGRGLVVGLRLACQSDGGEACFLGVEVVGVQNNCGHMMNVSLAPVTGRCFVHYPRGGPMVAANALPPLPKGSIEAEVWLVVGADGGIAVLRRCITCGSIEVAVELDAIELFSSASEFHASASFSLDKLTAPADLSIVWVGDRLPPHVSGAWVPGSAGRVTWYVESEP